ncbi:MAG: GntR family transcriptional regulator [Atopostipes suicloacalis]|nr:GntR family transcriptional regulator [Atopostipes suicloacalis]
MKINKESKVPLYYQLYESIARNIESGLLDENEKLPSEREICNQLGISRSTVRQAMYELEKEGYIYKEHGRGVFVSFESFRQNLLNFYSFTDEMIKIGKEPSSKVLDFEKIKASEKLAQKLDIEQGAALYQIRRLRLADDEAIMIETSYLPSTRFPDLKKETLEKRPMYDIFREDYDMRFSKAKEFFKSVMVRNYEAEVLEVSTQTPGMMIERYTYEAETIVEYTVSIARGDKFEYVVTLEK